MIRLMPRIAFAILAFLLLPLAAAAQEQAFTNRATELKDKAAAESRTLATLPENTEVKVIARGGGWTRVQAKDQQGWLRVYHLRFPATSQTASSDSAGLSTLTSALGFGRSKSQTASIATTGIRGLSPEDLKNASPDAAALAKAHSYRADKATADRFAREGKLVAVKVEAP
jgi:hypothetical protein